MKPTFAQVAQYLDALGVEYRRDYGYGKQGTEERHRFLTVVLTGLRLPFSPEEWCSLCMCEGDNYVGGCCGTLSAVQDKVEYAFRHRSGWVDGEVLGEVAELMASHDCDDSAFQKAPDDLVAAVEDARRSWAGPFGRAARGTSPTPWDKLALLYHLTKDYLRAKVPSSAGKHLSPLEAAMHTLARALDHLSYERVFGRGQERGENGRPNGRLTSQGEANRLRTLYKLLPALRVVQDGIAALDTGPFVGFALVEKRAEAQPDAIAENSLGPCIYHTREEVDANLARWREQEAQYEEKAARLGTVDERIGVRPIRISRERGLEFLDVPAPPAAPRSCNRHADCDTAEAEAAKRGVPECYGPGTARLDHCRDEGCEDCFGK